MRRPFRRFCFRLALSLGITLKEVMAMPSDELAEWAAFFLTKEEDWQKKYMKQLELDRQSELDAESRRELFKSLFKGKV